MRKIWSLLFSWYELNSIITIFTNPSARAGYDTRSIFKPNFYAGLNSEYSFYYTSCLSKAEEPSLSYYLPIARGRIIGFIPFPRVLGLCEIQSVSSRIWNRVAVCICYGDNITPQALPQYNYCPSTRMVWVLDNLQWLIWYQTKKPKPFLIFGTHILV